MTRITTFAALCVLTFCIAGAAYAKASAETPPYPFTNRYKATIYGTPPDARYVILGVSETDAAEIRSIKIEGRRIPEVFWYTDSVEYSVKMQKEQAPLIFVIAGTGGRFNSPKVRFLQELFYSAGYHAVAVSSPTHYNYLVSLSKHGISGYVPYDVEDLYTLMRWIKEDVEKTNKVSSYSVTGYSLGGLHSAFLAQRDAKDKVFNFDKVLVINPPVDLYSSALVFDSWLADQGDDEPTPQQSVEKFIESFSEFYRTNHIGRLDSEVLYRFFNTLQAKDEELMQLIGIGFRITASSMIFTSDVCLKAGYIVPADKTIETNDPLLPYFSAASRVSFEQYFDEFLLPYLQSRQPGMTKEKALADCTLSNLGPFLREAKNVYVIGNDDDPILNERELAYLKETFAERGHFFKHGGHCGNLQYIGFAQKLLELVKK
ncbi:alpha/beta fold hydrolase [Humidesulfovibrio sp.]